MKCASITLLHNPFWAVAFCSSGSQMRVSRRALAIYTVQIKFSTENNAHNGRSDDAPVDVKLALAYLYWMQYISLGFSTAQLSESWGHEPSSVVRSHFCHSHPHFPSELQFVSELLTWGLILWCYPACRVARSEAADTEPLSCCSLGTQLKQQAGDPVFLSEHQRYLVMGCAQLNLLFVEQPLRYGG